MASQSTDTLDFAALLVAIWEASSRAKKDGDVVVVVDENLEDFCNQWRSLVNLCNDGGVLSSSASLSSQVVADKDAIVDIVEHTILNTTGEKCRCWIEPHEWHALSKHVFVAKIIKPVICSVCFEPKESGYAKLVHPLVPQQWLVDELAKSPFFYSFIYAAYKYKAHEKLFSAIGSGAMMYAYGRLITKRRRKNQPLSINKLDSPVKQGELLCEHYIAPLVETMDVDRVARPIAPLSPPYKFDSVLISSTALQNDMYSLPSEPVKRIIATTEPCYISQICKQIASSIDKEIHDKLRCHHEGKTLLCSCINSRIKQHVSFE